MFLDFILLLLQFTALICYYNTVRIFVLSILSTYFILVINESCCTCWCSCICLSFLVFKRIEVCCNHRPLSRASRPCQTATHNDETVYVMAILASTIIILSSVQQVSKKQCVCVEKGFISRCCWRRMRKKKKRPSHRLLPRCRQQRAHETQMD